MLIVNRDKFLTFPKGTMYIHGTKWAFNEFFMKGETLSTNYKNVDYYACSFDQVDDEDLERGVFDFEEMLDKGISLPLDLAWTRDGMGDKGADDVFLIFEKPDLERLRVFIDLAIDLDKEVL